MTFEQAIQLKKFNDDYYDNQKEREVWNDEPLTKEQFFEKWLWRDEKCDTLKNVSTQ